MSFVRYGVAALALAAALTGCTTTPSATPEAATTPVTQAAAATPAIPTSTTVPANVDTASEQAAWEALMSPQGEYAAFAAYQGVIDKYGQVEPYVTAQNAEQRHIDALVRQLARTDVIAPANPYLGTIPAPVSLKEAAQAWANGEVANVAMYDRLLAMATDDTRLTGVLQNLRKASQDSHLPMFQAAAEKGGTLTADEMLSLAH